MSPGSRNDYRVVHRMLSLHMRTAELQYSQAEEVMKSRFPISWMGTL